MTEPTDPPLPDLRDRWLVPIIQLREKPADGAQGTQDLFLVFMNCPDNTTNRPDADDAELFFWSPYRLRDPYRCSGGFLEEFSAYGAHSLASIALRDAQTPLYNPDGTPWRTVGLWRNLSADPGDVPDTMPWEPVAQPLPYRLLWSAFLRSEPGTSDDEAHEAEAYALVTIPQVSGPDWRVHLLLLGPKGVSGRWVIAPSPDQTLEDARQAALDQLAGEARAENLTIIQLVLPAP